MTERKGQDLGYLIEKTHEIVPFEDTQMYGSLVRSAWEHKCKATWIAEALDKMLGLTQRQVERLQKATGSPDPAPIEVFEAIKRELEAAQNDLVAYEEQVTEHYKQTGRERSQISKTDSRKRMERCKEALLQLSFDTNEFGHGDPYPVKPVKREGVEEDEA